MNIGFVKQEQFTKDGAVVKYLKLNIRDIGVKFSATISKINEKSQDNSPDYHIYANINRRGEHYSRVQIGALWMKTSEKGNAYMSGYIESIAFPDGKIYISIVKYTPREGMPAEDKIYNVLWSPPQKSRGEYDDGRDSGGYVGGYTGQPAAPTPTDTTTTPAGVPVEISIDEEEIPF